MSKAPSNADYVVSAKEAAGRIPAIKEKLSHNVQSIVQHQDSGKNETPASTSALVPQSRDNTGRTGGVSPPPFGLPAVMHLEGEVFECSPPASATVTHTLPTSHTKRALHTIY